MLEQSIHFIDLVDVRVNSQSSHCQVHIRAINCQLRRLAAILDNFRFFKHLLDKANYLRNYHFPLCPTRL
jgi:hypothetical protein